MYSTMMKQAIWVRLFIYGWLVLLAIPAPVFAADSTPQLGQMEQQLFAHTYASDSESDRLDRLETAIYGASQAGKSPESRIQGLSQFFKNPQEFTANSPATQTTAPQQYKRPDIQEYGSNPLPQPLAVAKDESQYPAVTAMEQKVFHQSFEREVLDSRLARLEKRVMGQAQRGTLQERTDQLRMTVMGDTGTGGQSDPQPIATSDPYSDPQTNAPMNTASAAQNNAVASSDLIQALDPVEKKVLRQTFPQDTVSNRLNRLEMKVFNTTAPEMSPEDRLYRIVSVVNAQKSGRMEQAYRGGSGIGVGGNYSRASSSSAGTWGSMLLMILMSFI